VRCATLTLTSANKLITFAWPTTAMAHFRTDMKSQVEEASGVERNYTIFERQFD